MISYELTLILTILSVIVLAGSLDLRAIADAQPTVGSWIVWKQPLAFVLFVIATFAETNRHPFDFAECEPELVGGFHTEYSAMKFALFFLGEYAAMTVMACLTTTLFLGGSSVPFLPHAHWAIGFAAFLAKTACFLFLFLWVAGAAPVPLRSAHGPRLEGLPAARAPEPRRHGVVVRGDRQAQAPLDRRAALPPRGLPRPLDHVPEDVRQALDAAVPRGALPKTPVTRGSRASSSRTMATSPVSCGSARPRLAYAITIDGGETDRPIEREPVRFDIDMLRCILCGFCEEACPKDAIYRRTSSSSRTTRGRRSSTTWRS
jgi:hypothetical protein